MTGVPTPKRLAELLAISRAQASDGPPAAATRPIVVDERGYAFGLCPDDPDDLLGSFVHAGLRLAWAPMPVGGGLLLSLWGGLEPEAGYEEEGITAFITGEGLRRLATDLIAIADAAVVSRAPASAEGEQHFASTHAELALYDALLDCTKRLEVCARAGGNGDNAVQALLEPFRAALAAVSGNFSQVVNERDAAKVQA